jgi:hypothetical protein
VVPASGGCRQFGGGVGGGGGRMIHCLIIILIHFSFSFFAERFFRELG